MLVYAVFLTEGDGDSYRKDILKGIFSSVDIAINYCKQQLLFCELEIELDPEQIQERLVHISMTIEEPIYVGNRSDCNKMLSYKNSGGFIIEEITVVDR